MFNKVTVLFYILLLINHSQAIAQFNPSNHQHLKSLLHKKTLNDSLHFVCRDLKNISEEEARVLFTDLPTLRYCVLVVDGARRNEDEVRQLQQKAELKLRLSGIQALFLTDPANNESDSTIEPILTIMTNQNFRTGEFSGSVELREKVILQRSTRGTMRCKIYEEEGPWRKTPEEAVNDMWKSLDEFCLMKIKFSKK